MKTRLGEMNNTERRVCKSLSGLERSSASFYRGLVALRASIAGLNKQSPLAQILQLQL